MSIAGFSTGKSESLGDFSGVGGEHVSSHGHLGWFVTGLFVVGDLAGGGLVALPTAMIQSGFWGGLVISLVMTLVVTYTAYVLGLSWNILLDRWPEYHSHCRKPYPEIGYRALGVNMRRIVSVCIDVTQFGVAVVYLLLSSKNIHDFLKAFVKSDLSFCIVILCLAVCLLPVTFLKSPNDFWWAVVIAMMTTSMAVMLILVGASIDYEKCHKEKAMPDFHITNYFLALGTFLFAYGGHSAFPTIQHDMRRPAEFTKSVILAFSIMAVMYFPVCIMGYIVYGNSVQDSIINSIQLTGIQQAINILITVHCILTLTIVFNPLMQEVEEIFRVPQHFGIGRVVVRSGIMVCVVIVAETIPTFGPLLDLVGGSTLTLTSVVFPCVFYLWLAAAQKKAEDKKCPDDGPCSFSEMVHYTPRKTLFICGFITVFGLIGGCAATYSAIKELTTSSVFTTPCYAQGRGFVHTTGDSGHTNCCGRCQNVKTHSDVKCSDTKLDFYHDTHDWSVVCANTTAANLITSTVANQLINGLFGFN
ncbi:unnamed protein product, partial [Mesorhabditis belari]|uniref:Amino acid transporter transmembrane domain-containing protein n=1 Tax=Mesorhabditis belari TaxID=2138241 RepID=A0AAF3EYZ4_9BILA